MGATQQGLTFHIPSGDMPKLTDLVEKGFLTVRRELAGSSINMAGSNSSIRFRVTDKNHQPKPKLRTLEEPFGDQQQFNDTSSSDVPAAPDHFEKVKTEVIHLEQLPPQKDLIAQIVCCICGGFPRSPLYFCGQGHPACFFCGQAIIECPVADLVTTFPCRKRFVRTACLFYDFLYSQSTIRCPYAFSGCKETPSGNFLARHKAECSFRPYVRCPVSGCPIGNTSCAQYVDHVADFHNVQVTGLSTYTLRLRFDESKIGSHRYVGAISKHAGLEFAFCVEEDSSDCKLWVSSMNNPGVIKGRNFKCTFRLTSETNNYKLQWQGEVHPRERSVVSIMNEGDCLVVTKVLLWKKYVFNDEEEGGKFWSVDVSISEVTNNMDIGWNGWTMDGLAPESSNKLVAPQGMQW